MHAWIFILCFLSAALFSFDKLCIYEEKGQEALLHRTSDPSEMAHHLHLIGVRFEQWQASQPLSEGADQAAVLKAYRSDIERLQRENGYQSVDVIRMTPHTPNKPALRQKFLNEHIHAEDEVRFFVEGSGLFYLHVDGKVYIALCEQGDLISIPPHYRHWFDMGEEPFFTAIRFFTTPDGWVASFTESGISKKFPEY